jgi:hypothetical protein
MKLFLSFILTISFLVTKSQTTYVGLIRDKNSNGTGLRPYVNTVLMEDRFIGNSIYRSLLGVGMSSLGNVSLSVGFDIEHPISYSSDINLIYGGYVEIMGMEDVHKSFIHNVRLGVGVRNWMLMFMNNWEYRRFTLGNDIGYEPKFKPTFGVFYKIN